MPTVLLPLASLLDPVGAVPRAVEARKWLIPLLLACLATGFSGVAIALRLDASRVVIPELAKSGELAKASEREIDEKIEQTQRVAIVAGVAKAVVLVPLEVLAVAVMLKLLAWLLGKKTEFGALFTVGALTFLPVAVFHLVLGASALRQEVLTISLLAELVPTSLTAVLKDASPGLARLVRRRRRLQPLGGGGAGPGLRCRGEGRAVEGPGRRAGAVRAVRRGLPGGCPRAGFVHGRTSVMSWSAAVVVALAMSATPLTLEDVREASQRNLQAVQAALNVESAGTGKTQAFSAILPRVDVTASVGGSLSGPQRFFSTVPSVNPDGTVGYVQKNVDVDGAARTSFSIGAQVTQLLYDGGKWWSQVAQAGAQFDAARGQADEQRLVSELEAVRRFYEVVRAQLTLKVLAASVERSQAQLERAQSLFGAGRVQKRDVLDAEVNLGNDRISVLRQELQLRSSQVDLTNWLMTASTEFEAVSPPAIAPGTPPRPGPSQEKALAVARSRRPLLASLEAQSRAQTLGIDATRGDFFPRISAMAAYQRQGATADPFFTDPTRQNSLTAGLNLSWNVFAGYATSAQEQNNRIALRNLEAQVAQAKVELENELGRGLSTLSTQVAVAQLAERNRALSAEQLHGEEERYAAGAGNSLDVRNAQLKLTQSELQQLAGRIDVEIARAALRRTIGADVEEAP